MLTPLLVELQRVLPEAEVDIVVAGDWGADLFRTFANVRHCYVLSRRMVRNPIAIIRTVMRIRRAGYDLAIDPCEASQSSRFLVAAAGAACVLGIPRQADANSAGPLPARLAPAHMAQWPVFLLRRASRHQPAALDDDYPTLTLRLSSDERQWGRRILDGLLRDGEASSGKLVIGVFAEATGAKRYAQDWWERFIETMRVECNCVVVEIAPPDGRTRLASGLPAFSSPSPREVAAVIGNMTCFVSADCGVMHLATASATPTIGLFCVSDMAKYRPYGLHNHAIDTNGKEPEAVARLASGLVATLISNGGAMALESPLDLVVPVAGSDSPQQQAEPILPVAAR
ncbi:MAG: glycosyltransferase family 9 protein [Rhodanobacter sp.]